MWYYGRSFGHIRHPTPLFSTWDTGTSHWTSLSFNFFHLENGHFWEWVLRCILEECIPDHIFWAQSRHIQDWPRRKTKRPWFQMSSIFPNWEHSKGLKVPSRVQRLATSCITGGSVGRQQPAHVTPKPQKVCSWATGASGGDELWDPCLPPTSEVACSVLISGSAMHFSWRKLSETTFSNIHIFQMKKMKSREEQWFS